MSSITKPAVRHPQSSANELGLSLRDYEGRMSTLCAGCGHDSITSTIIRAAWELAIAPHRVVKMSGIGCSSKTPTYFLGGAHGINAIHGRMPSVATGANAANRDLHYIGVSGDGDSLSIGIGQFAHAARRNLNMLYILENNGVYGLTKGQFSASADPGSRLKKGEENQLPSIDAALMAISMGAPFVARSFSGDKDQLIPLIKAGLLHPGFAVIDVISPCVTFNNHEASTKSYRRTRETVHEIMTIHLQDGSDIQMRKTDETYDPTDRVAAQSFIQRRRDQGEIVTGLLYIDKGAPEMHEVSGTTTTPLVDLPYDCLHPGAAGLADFQRSLR